MVRYSVVIPVFKGELTLKKLTAELIGFFNNIKESFEIIFVDDYSHDNSWEIIKSIKTDHGKAIRGIRLSRNFGQHNALTCGLLNAEGEFIVTMDEDLQHSPQDIIYLIKKQKESDYDLVYGRFRMLNHSIFRNLTSGLLKKLLRIGLPGLHPDYSAFRIIKSGFAQNAVSRNASYAFIDAYFSSVNNNTGSVEVRHSKRYAGQSSYNVRKLISHSVGILINYSLPPLRILTWSILTLLFALFSSGVFLVLLNLYQGASVSGWLSVCKAGLLILLLAICSAGAIYLAILIFSITKIKKSGFIVGESI